jgi:hypothetical protein
MLNFKRVAVDSLNNRGYLKILNFKFQNIRTLNEILGLYPISNKKPINHKVVNHVKIYNFSIKFIFIQLHIKTLQFFETTISIGGPLKSVPFAS